MNSNSKTTGWGSGDRECGARTEIGYAGGREVRQGGAVTDSQSGFRALNRKAVQLLAGALRREEIEAFGIVAVEDINGWSRTVGLMAAR